MKILYIDLETTGLSPANDAIIQASGTIIAGDQQEVFDLRMRPPAGVVMNRESLVMGGLTGAEVARHPLSQEEGFASFLALLDKYVNRYDRADKFTLIGYNSRFDDEFLRAWFTRFNDPYYGSWFWFPPLDVMQLAAFSLIGERPYMENFKLKTVYKHLTGKELEEAHTANADIAATQEILSIVWKRWNVLTEH